MLNEAPLNKLDILYDYPIIFVNCYYVQKKQKKQKQKQIPYRRKNRNINLSYKPRINQEKNFIYLLRYRLRRMNDPYFSLKFNVFNYQFINEFSLRS